MAASTIPDSHWPLIVFRDADKFPLAVGISALANTAYRPVYDLAMAASILATIPIIILFFLLRRQFMEGVTVTGTGVEKSVCVLKERGV